MFTAGIGLGAASISRLADLLQGPACYDARFLTMTFDVTEKAGVHAFRTLKNLAAAHDESMANQIAPPFFSATVLI